RRHPVRFSAHWEARPASLPSSRRAPIADPRCTRRGISLKLPLFPGHFVAPGHFPARDIASGGRLLSALSQLFFSASPRGDAVKSLGPRGECLPCAGATAVSISRLR